MFAQALTRALVRLGLDKHGLDAYPRRPAPMLLQRGRRAMTRGGPNERNHERRSGGHSRSEDGKPTPKPGDIYEIEDSGPAPWRAKKLARKPPKASPTGDEDDHTGA